MAVSLDHFRQAAIGDAARLEVNSKGIDLNRKGLSAGGKAVEWIRDAAGLRTDRNQQVMQAFVQALRTGYDPSIASEMEGRLGQTVGQGKPLSARVVREIIQDADAIKQERAENAVANRSLAQDFSHAGPQDRLSGYMASAVSVGKTLGLSDDMVGTLFDTDDPKVMELRQKIGDGIRDLGGPEPKAVSRDAAKDLAEREIKRFLCEAANSKALDGAIGAGDPEAPLQQALGNVAREMGLPGMANLLADPKSEIMAQFKASAMISMPNDEIADTAFVARVVNDRVPRFLVREAVSSGQAGSITSLPRDPVLAADVGRDLISKVFSKNGPATARPAVAAMLNGEIDRLAQDGPKGAEAARSLQKALLNEYARIGDPAVKLALLTRERDHMLAEARSSNADGHWFAAASMQNDIVALHLDQLGQPKTAQRSATLDNLSKNSPELAKAMAGLDDIERQYVAAKGGDAAKVSLGWKESRDQLAQIREAARELDGATGSELQAYISAKMRGLTANLVANAVATLGPPPAPMAVISLGSASRGEASPYSDVEFGILLDRPADAAMKEYTARLTELVRFQVANLGENVGHEAPAGFHWDTGGNTPLEDPRHFVGTAAELIQANLGETEGSAGGARPDRMFGFTMFSNTELLYGPSGGDAEWGMVKDMQQKVDAHFQSKSGVVGGQSRGEALGRWAMEEGANLAKLRRAATAETVDVKALARMPMMMAQGLALAHGLSLDEGGIAANSTVMRLASLANAGVITREEASTLSDAFAKLGEIRIKAHLHAGDANDTVHLDPTTANGAFAAPELAPIIQDLLPFVDRIERYLTDPSRPF